MFIYQRLCTRPHFETEAKDNWKWAIYSIMFQPLCEVRNLLFQSAGDKMISQYII